jgi:hypothetical protein
MRLYDPQRDREAVFRIYREVGWIEEDKGAAFDALLGASHALVGDVNGSAECLVLSIPGTLDYQGERLRFWGINGVTTSRVARKLGLAQRLTAESVARAADDGAAVMGLGMFEQGFYNQLGFGVGSYVHDVAFDPAELTVDRSFGVPLRLGKEQAAEMHRARLKRMHWHGMVDLEPEGITISECEFPKDAFGLGYRDTTGELTHYFWCHARNEHGPYNIWWMIYRTWDQFMELLALLKALGDQVHTMTMGEPVGIQMQDLIRKPFKTRRIRRRSEYESGITATAFWQVRICDLAACLQATHLPGPTVRFNLTLDDPITAKLTERAGWRGVSGDYTVTLGQESSAVAGSTPGLPTLTATVNAFSRLWLGVQPATGLAVTDDLYGPPELLRQLDRTLRLPPPNMDWYF